MKRNLPFLLTALLLLFTRPIFAQITCQTGGNLWVYSNYDGGTININVDVNQPNIKIGICTYEPVTINISGPFAANVTEVRYAGYLSTNNFNCPGNPTTSTINGVPVAIQTLLFLPPATLSNPNGNNSIVCGYSCSTTSNQGGCNTADQIKAYFQTTMNATLVSYDTQYNCWSNASTYSLSAGGNCCSSTTSCLIAANAGPDITVCQGSGVQLNGSAVGGATTYSWSPSTGLSNPNITNPIASPTVTTTYILTASDGGVCADTDTITVTVPTTSVTFTPLPGVCQGGGGIALSGASPSGGTWTGPGVLNNVFDPGPSGVGTFTLGYTAIDGNGCTVSGTTSIEVFALPSVGFSLAGSYCTSDPAFALVSGTPAGGTYAGPGVANGQFIPSVAGPGLHTILYAYTDGNGCSDTVSGQLTVAQSPATPTLSIGGSDSLYSSTVGTSYTWLLNGVVVAVTTTQPYIATQNGNYTVFVSNGNCNSDTSASVQIELTAITLPDGQVIQVWPNPARDYVQLSAGNLRVAVTLYDLAGKQVRAPQVVEASGTLSLAGLSRGVYVLQVQHEGRVGTMRIIKE